MICAVCDKETKEVLNIIIAEASDLSPEGTFLVEVLNGVVCNIGWTWDGTNFINPNPPEPEIV